MADVERLCAEAIDPPSPLLSPHLALHALAVCVSWMHLTACLDCGGVGWLVLAWEGVGVHVQVTFGIA